MEFLDKESKIIFNKICYAHEVIIGLDVCICTRVEVGCWHAENQRQYIVAGTSQVETSKLLITSDEKKSQVAEGHAWFFLSQVISNFDVSTCEVPATIYF